MGLLRPQTSKRLNSAAGWNPHAHPVNQDSASLIECASCSIVSHTWATLLRKRPWTNGTMAALSSGRWVWPVQLIKRSLSQELQGEGGPHQRGLDQRHSPELPVHTAAYKNREKKQQKKTRKNKNLKVFAPSLLACKTGSHASFSNNSYLLADRGCCFIYLFYYFVCFFVFFFLFFLLCSSG